MLKVKTIELMDGSNSFTFEVRQMSAVQLYDYMNRLVLLFADGNLKITMDSDLGDLGKLFLADGLGMLKGIDYEKARPMMDELLGCCWHVVKGTDKQRLSLDILDAIITDPRNIYKLLVASIKHNFGFFMAGVKETEVEESQSNTPVQVNIGRPRKQKD